MKYDDPNQPDSPAGHSNQSTEHQLRREVEELKRIIQERESGHSGLPEKRWKPSGVTVSALLMVLVVVLVGAFFAGYIPMQRREALVRAESKEQEKALPKMDVIQLIRATSQTDMRLPGNLQAVTEAPILARADGYLKKRYVDLGDRVQAGQPLAEIDAPELDQQIRQAEAAVAQTEAAAEQAQASVEQAQAAVEQAKANRDLASLTASRWKTLAAQGVVSQQENDQYQAQLVSQNANVQALERAVNAQKSNVAAQRSNIAAAKANLARLEQVQGYRVVKAPFAGVITLRNVDIGALVSTGNTLLFRIAQTGTLRTYVNVPQSDANSVRIGQAATLTLSNFPDRQFSGSVARTANALDPSSRTMLVEVDVPNVTGALLPGMYAEVVLRSKRENPPLVVPASAIITRTDGAQVAVVDSNGILHLQKIMAGRDYGDRVEILQGVEEGATILATPGDTAREGVKIIPVLATPKPQQKT
jgi:multidrug efflux pump subunit AcrA (membrane-fusion protein)